MQTALRHFRLLPLLVLLVVSGFMATGCTTVPATPTPPAYECNWLASEIAQADVTRREAQEQQQGAWKFVIPVAVVARYASSSVQLSDAEKRLGDLRARFQQMQCASEL